MKLSQLSQNAAAAETGRWVNHIPELGGLVLKVRGLDNADYRRLSAQLAAEIPRADRILGVATEVTDAMQTRLIVETILIDWRGLEEDDGAPVPYSRDMATKLLTDPNYRAFRAAVIWAAGVVGDDRLASDEADAKN